MPILPIEALSIDYRIDTLLACSLLIIDIKNLSIASRQILELDMLSFGLLTTMLISSFTISWIYSITNILNLLSLFNAF